MSRMGTLEMSRKERVRLEVFARVRDGEISLSRAAGLVGLSLRQARRSWKRYRQRGDAGLTHGLRGRDSNHKTRKDKREAVVKLYREKYADFGPTLACEHLAEEGYTVNRETLRLWLSREGLWEGRRQRKRHRSRRERRACLGEMVQMDGSDHDWFEGRRGRAVLMVVIDDATGRVFARFFEGETTAAAFDVFGAYVQKYGVPRALYVDRDSIYRSDRQATVEEELRADSPLTQFGRAMKALAVELILANSPQAKGRVERANGTLQDRLVKAMRLAGISDIAAANVFLTRTFLPAFNRRFMVEAREKTDVHVALSKALPRDSKLDEVLCWEELRVVQNDWCVQWRNRVFQLDRRHEALGLAGQKVIVREKQDGTIQLLSKGHMLHWKELEQRPSRASEKKPIINNKRYVPAPGHPWKGPIKARGENSNKILPAAGASSATPPKPQQRKQAPHG